MKKQFCLFGIILLALLTVYSCKISNNNQLNQQEKIPNFSQFNSIQLEEQKNLIKQQYKNKGSKNKSLNICSETAFAEGHILSDYLLEFKKIVESLSLNQVTVSVISGERSEEEVNIRCSNRTIDMQSTGGEPLEVFAPEYFFFNAPYVIKDYDHFQRVWASDIGTKAKKLVKKNGNLQSVATVFRGLRQMTSNTPINGTDEIKGLKLRLPGVPDWITVWKELEADVVAVPLTGLYDALASGKAEASEGDLTQINSFKLYEVQNHLSITNHLVAVGWITLNKDFYNDLNFIEKILVLFASEVASDRATDKIFDTETTLLTDLQKKGMTIGYPDAEAIRAKAKPAVDKLFEKSWPVTTWEEVLSK